MVGNASWLEPHAPGAFLAVFTVAALVLLVLFLDDLFVDQRLLHSVQPDGRLGCSVQVAFLAQFAPLDPTRLLPQRPDDCLLSFAIQIIGLTGRVPLAYFLLPLRKLKRGG